MLWFYLSLLAALFWSFTSILDKHVLSDEMKDPIMATTVASFVLFLPLGLLSLVSNPLVLPTPLAAFSLLSGVFYSLAIFFLFEAAKREEISRVVPLINLNPVLVLLASLLFLGELLTPLKYLGIALLIAGAVLISLKRRSRLKTRHVLFLALLSAAFYATRSLLLEVSTLHYSLEQVFSWVGLGGLLVGLAFLAIHHPHLRRKSKEGIEILVFSNLLALLAFFLFASAISLAPVSLVSVVSSVSIFFVFLIATALSKTHSHIIREEMRGSTLLLKTISLLLVFLGLLLIL